MRENKNKNMRIKFTEEDHKYTADDGTNYTSVSEVVHSLELKKDWDAIRKKYAKKHGGTATEWKDKWELKAKLSTQAGTSLHEELEDELLSKGTFTIDNKECTVISTGKKSEAKYSFPLTELQDNTVYPELMIYDHTYKVCGQSDMVTIANGTIHILDYKTDKAIKRKAFSTDFVDPEKLLSPVSHLDNCNFNVYSLKMSLYMYMVWKQNTHLKCGNIILIHKEIERDADEVPVLYDGKPKVLKTTEIQLPFLRKEVKEILKSYKK